jgi:hypothetical protein
VTTGSKSVAKGGGSKDFFFQLPPFGKLVVGVDGSFNTGGGGGGGSAEKSISVN